MGSSSTDRKLVFWFIFGHFVVPDSAPTALMGYAGSPVAQTLEPHVNWSMVGVGVYLQARDVCTDDRDIKKTTPDVFEEV